jgi:branched-chain amino acid transport system permease protein
MYNPSTLLQFLMSGIGVGCIYGLVGMGFTVVYNATGIVNFAQGGFVMLGGMTTYLLYAVAGLPLLPAATLAIVVVGGIGYLMELAVIRPLRKRQAPIFVLILATLAVQVILENVTLHAVDDQPHLLPPFTDRNPFMLFHASIGFQTLWIIGISLLMVFALGLLYRRTLIGKAMRACAINPEVAQILGIRIERITAIAFALSAALGAIGGILITPTQYTAFYIGLTFAVSGFVAAIIGGLGNALGAFVGGIILGILQAAGVIFIDAGYKNVIAFSMLLLLLFLRPNGLFGSLIEHD